MWCSEHHIKITQLRIREIDWLHWGGKTPEPYEATYFRDIPVKFI